MQESERLSKLMKIIQYNIFFGDDDKTITEMRIENICRQMNEYKVDILCFQEVLREMYDLIVGLLLENYPYVYPTSSDLLDTVYGTVIFSKHQFHNTIRHKYEITTMGRDIKFVVIQCDDEKVCVCTSHFESEFKDQCMKKIYQYNRCSDILEQVHKKTNLPIILCSDTNVCKNTEGMFNDAFSTVKGWRDAWTEFSEKEDCEYTFDTTTNPILLDRHNHSNVIRARIDRILHMSDFYCVDYELLGTDKNIIMSDHYGIMCTFSKVKI